VSEQTPLDWLTEEHRQLQLQVAELEATLRTLSFARGPDREQGLATFGQRATMFAQDLTAHQRKEDEVVFPDAQYLLDRATSPVLTQFFAGEAEEDVFTHATLLAHTQEFVGLLPGLRRAEMRAHALSVISTLGQLLARHTAHESGVVFPLLVEALSAEQLGAIGLRFGDYRSLGDLRDPAELARQGLVELGSRDDLG
jgi:hemerythrin-like domain-containing protein